MSIPRFMLALCAAILVTPAWLPAPAAPNYFSPLARAAATDFESLDRGAADDEDAEREAFREARLSLNAGNLEKARTTAEEVLPLYPYSLVGYQLMYDIAKAAEDPVDQLRWAKWLYWGTKYRGETKQLEDLLPLFEGLGDSWNRDELLLEEWEDSLADAAKKASGKKQYRLAGHLMDRLIELNVGDTKLEKDYDKLAKKAGQQLSGGSFLAASIGKKSPDWLARENRKHEHWESPFERETRNYDLYTNVSWEFAETLSAAMEQVNEFYREIYDYRKKARAKIYVMRKRSDFDKMSLEVLNRPQPNLGVGGYWVAAQKTVVAYDRAYDEEGFTKTALWQTLFHEASHQFMTLLSKERHIVPCWLNEGTASYFEGCEIKADGTVVKNAPAVHRLISWYNIDNSEDRISLDRLIAHPRNIGPDENFSLSYEGEYYPYGWALVYFLLNYEENDRRVMSALTDSDIPEGYKEVRKAGRLVYRDAYAKYLEHFSERGSGGDMDYPLEIAKQYFVDDIGDPNCATWEKFEERWRTFTRSLYFEEQAGPEFAEVLHARSRGYLEAGDFERARVTAEQADAKRPNDPETYRLLAISNAGEKLKEDAVYWMVRHWERVFPIGDTEQSDAAEEWLLENGGKDVLELYILPTKQVIEELGAACEEAIENENPMLAVLAAVHGCEVLNMDPASLTKYFGMGEQAEGTSALASTGKDLRVWQEGFRGSPEQNRSYTEPGLEVDVVRYDRDGLFLNNPEGRARPGDVLPDRRALQHLTAPYSIRGEFEADGKAGMALGRDNSGRAQSILVFEFNEDGNPVCRACIVSLVVDTASGKASTRIIEQHGSAFPAAKTAKFELNVEADGKVSLVMNGSDEYVLPAEYFPLRRFQGGMALTALEGGVALFSDVQIRPSRPFWPVP